MNALVDDSLVGLALVAGFGYAMYSLGPKSWRGPLSSAAASLLGRVPIAAVRAVAGRLDAAAGKAGTCGGCENCGSNVSGGTGRDVAGKGPGSADISIPLSRIGKRR